MHYQCKYRHLLWKFAQLLCYSFFTRFGFFLPRKLWSQIFFDKCHVCQVVPQKSKSFKCLWTRAPQIFSKAGFVERLSVGAVLGAGGGEEPVARSFIFWLSSIVIVVMVMMLGAWCFVLVAGGGEEPVARFSSFSPPCSLLFIAAPFCFGHFRHSYLWYHHCCQHLHIHIPSFFSIFSLVS